MDPCELSSSSKFNFEIETTCAVMQNIVSFKKRVWVHNINLRRKEKGEYHHLINNLKEDRSRYENYFRMTKEEFEVLHDLIKEDIKTENTQMREAISTREKLTFV
ncbi:hypothetical protein PUN28_006162 [Cardiocondyla obscurior]|uniref:Uncharacterized protein n=1 Tax=Cardiocondyla obscurior TaxID=286306 RepID=A0AAW2G7D7_9HYME